MTDRAVSLETVIGMVNTYFRNVLNLNPDLLIDGIVSLPTVDAVPVRCGQCKYAEVADKEDVQDGYTCQFHRGSIWFSGSYCSWGEMREE